MPPDVGAIIGISLAGSLLLVAIVFICLMHFPCCWNGNGIRPLRRSRNGNGNQRPSTSSRTAITNFGFNDSTRDLATLSAIDLQRRTQSHFYNRTSIVNPGWQLHCVSCEILPSNQNNNSHPSHDQHQPHQCQRQVQSTNQCSCCQRPLNSIPPPRSENRQQPHSPGSHSTSSFQYHTPQLMVTDSPPPYPGVHRPRVQVDLANQNQISMGNPPPPYTSPKPGRN